MIRAKRYFKPLILLITFAVLMCLFVTPVMALSYDRNNPAPPVQFTSPVNGQVVIVSSSSKPQINFSVPSDPNFYTYCSQFDLQLYDSSHQWRSYMLMSAYQGRIDYSAGQYSTSYMPPGTYASFRVRTISNTGAVSSWTYSGSFKSNTPISTPPVLSISPNSTAANNCFESTVRLSWQPCADPDGQTITYQVELGTWDGAQYAYLPVAKTTDTALDYDISKSWSYNNTTIPAVNRGHQFAFRIRANDGFADTSYTVVSGLHRNSAPNTVTSVQTQASKTFMGKPAQVSFTLPQDVDGNIAGYEAALKDTNGNWYNNGEIVGSVDSPDSTSLMINPGSWSMSVSHWTCYIRAYDSYGVRGPWSESGADISYISEFFETGSLSSGDSVFSILGSAEPSIVSAEVTLSTCFVINPNAEDIRSRFISPTISIRNMSTMPVGISILSCKATGSAPKIVSPDTYSQDEWSKLGFVGSMKYISLGLSGSKSGSFWFGDEASQQEQSIGVFSAGEEADYLLQARFGLAWKEPENLKYDLIFEIRMV